MEREKLQEVKRRIKSVNASPGEPLKTYLLWKKEVVQRQLRDEEKIIDVYRRQGDLKRIDDLLRVLEEGDGQS